MTNRSRRNPLISRSPNYYTPKQRVYPCWCGANLIKQYRAIDFCCLAYLHQMGPHIYLDLG